ncbi:MULTISPECIES: PGPGW domain-containing protein [Micrococcales]|uniref:PGPGW domain-containing protein n=1 Tax=Micrococcales TaxID=85006 RepID=UPI00068B74FA|nr:MULTISPECIES: PGPGW domain-containing protein [Micrococcales]
MGIEKEIEQGQQEGRLHHALNRVRRFTQRHPALALCQKIIVTIIGGAIVLAGIVMLVTPGPGWLAIFLGLGLLATEYPIIHRFNQWAKAKVVNTWHRLGQWRMERKARRQAARERRAQARVARMQHRQYLDAQFRRSHNCAPHRSPKNPRLVMPRPRGAGSGLHRVPKV